MLQLQLFALAHSSFLFILFRWRSLFKREIRAVSTYLLLVRIRSAISYIGPYNLIVNFVYFPSNICSTRALDSFEKSLKFGSSSWANRSTVLGNRAATLMMLNRYSWGCPSAVLPYFSWSLDASLFDVMLFVIRFIEAAEDCATAILGNS